MYVCAIDLQRLTSFNVVSGLFCSVVVVPMHVLGCIERRMGDKMYMYI